MHPKTLRYVFVVSLAWLLTAAASAQGFVSQLTSEERIALRIDEMSPTQIAALEVAVARYVATGTEMTAGQTPDEQPTEALLQRLAEREAELRDVSAQLATTQTALKSKDAELKRSIGELGKAMLGLAPVYANTESRLAEPFSGWQKGTLFRLENGQVWRVIEGEYWAKTQPPGKSVKILPGIAKSYFLSIEGVRPQPRVVPVED